MILQEIPPDVSLVIDESRATLRRHTQTVRSWPVTRIDALATAQASEHAGSAALLFIERASPAALTVLREQGTSYATRAGEWYLVDPPRLLVIRPADRKPAMPPNHERPLPRGAARIARWLLLHPDEPMTITQLARATGISEATSSRAVAQLAERALLAVSVAADARRRTVAVADRGALLDALADESAWRRARWIVWDVGAADVDAALSRIRQAAAATPLPYAVGELAGAAQIERVVEPATVTLWVDPRDLAAWQDALLAHPARQAPGRLTVRAAPDPAILEWGDVVDGLHVADPVQVYIDCRHAGERAIDAAQAIRRRLVSP